jgi:hypothetical protein
MDDLDRWAAIQIYAVTGSRPHPGKFGINARAVFRGFLAALIRTSPVQLLHLGPHLTFDSWTAGGPRCFN